MTLASNIGQRLRARAKAPPRKAAVMMAIVLLVILALASPFVVGGQAIDIDERRDISLSPGVRSIELNVRATIGQLEVSFAELDGKAVEVTAQIEGTTIRPGSGGPLELTAEYRDDVASGGDRMVANITFDAYAPWPYYSLDSARYSVVVDPSLNATLDLGMTTGGITLSTAPGVVLEGLRLNATSNGAAVTFNNGTMLSGDVRIHTATGGTLFRWYDVEVKGHPTIALSESSGDIDAVFYQHRPLNGSMTVKAAGTLGDMSLSLDLSGVNSAEVKSSKGATVTGEGFTGSLPASLRSDNYRDGGVHRMDVQLNNTRGDIVVDGRWAGSV